MGKYSGSRKYKNDEITVFWKPDACIHASYCYRELIEVFDPARRPWVDMEGSATERIIEVVNMCPTEALSWKWNEEERNKTVGKDQLNHVRFRRPELMAADVSEEPENSLSVKIMPDGPIIIKGDFTLRYSGHCKDVKNGIISICRCGSSNQLPFCDGSHRKIGFEDI